MAKNNARSFRAGLRSRLDIRTLLKGDSYFIRAAIFLLMSGIFLLLVTVTKHGTRTTQQVQDSTEDSPTTTRPHLQLEPPSKPSPQAKAK